MRFLGILAFLLPFVSFVHVVASPAPVASISSPVIYADDVSHTEALGLTFFTGLGLNGASGTAAQVSVSDGTATDTLTTNIFANFQVFLGFDTFYKQHHLLLYYQYDTPYKVSFYSISPDSYTHVDILSPAHNFNIGYDYYFNPSISLGFFGGAAWYRSTVSYFNANNYGSSALSNTFSYSVGGKVEYYPLSSVGIAFKYTFYGSYEPTAQYTMPTRSTYSATLRYIFR